MTERKLPRREFISKTAQATAGLMALPYISRGQPAAAKRTGQPNLVFFFTDQQSWDMLGANGNQQILTPQVDRFAETATNFNHCVSNCPVCTPARGMIMSGQHPLYNGCFTNDTQLLSENAPSMGRILNGEGYDTCYIGKWHLYGGPRPRPIPPGEHRHGFDTFLSNNATLDFRPGHAFYYDDAGNKKIFDEWEAYGQTRQAVDFIDQQPSDKPFALYLSIHPPHDQGLTADGLRYRSIPELMDRYNKNDIRLRNNMRPSPDAIKKFGSEEAFREQVQEDYHGYYAMTSGCDDCFGQVLEALERNGLDENTIVVFTSDHGDLLYSHGRPWPKSFPEDESVRVPLLIRNPGKTPEGYRSDLVFGTLEFMPTLLAMMGIEPPEECHGKDVSQDIYRKNDDAITEQPLFYFIPSWRGLYTRRHTYAWDEFGGKDWQDWRVLYDREADPDLLTNFYFSNDPELIALREDLHRRSQAWLDHFEDPNLGGYEMLGMLGAENPFFAHPGKTGYFGGRPIDIIHEKMGS